MKIFKLLKILFIINTVFLLTVGIVFAQEGEKLKDSTDTALVDGVKQIQKSKQQVEAGVDELTSEESNQDIGTEVIKKESDNTVDVDLENETGQEVIQDEEILVDSEKPLPRITLEESFNKAFVSAIWEERPF